ncbi:GGDEF domain-containing protein [Lacibacterium aquatile]|uniref:diguanylate cyclase n=1 Tax=Lacibacterium aquatile TaxID=1168082 RepID=A0ABW5DNJ1_9PROT
MLELLDIRTIFFLFGLIALFIGATMLAVSHWMKADVSLLDWGIGSTMAGLGVLLLYGRGYIPDWVSIPLANVIAMTGQTFVWVAMRRFFDVKNPYRLPFLITGAWCVLFVGVYVVDASLTVRTLVSTAWTILITAASAYAAVRGARGRLIGPAVVIAVVFALLCVFAIFRMINAYRFGVDTVFSNSGPVIFYFLTGILASITSSASFLLLTIARLHARLDKLATLDSLTEVYNRRSLDKMGEVEAERARRTGQPLCLLVADLDHFKQINDAYGHPAGDTVLKEFVARVRDGLRAQDILGRYGGEEFVILLPATEIEQAIQVAERVRTAWSGRAMPISATPPLMATVSIGIAMGSGPSIHLEKLYGAADRALYQAKQAGRNRVVVAS